MKKIVLTLFILTSASSIAAAQQPQYIGGMKYTSISKPETKKEKTVYNRITPQNNANEKPEVETNEEEKPIEQSVWDRYKELAAGESKPKEETNKIETVEKSAETEQSQQAAPTGMAGIIAEYQKRKARRSQMRSISFTKPDTEESKTQETKPEK